MTTIDELEGRVNEHSQAIDLLTIGLAQHQELLQAIVATLREHSQRFDHLESRMDALATLIRDTHSDVVLIKSVVYPHESG